MSLAFVAKRLSARLLILQCMFTVGGVWCHASGMQFVMLQECNLSRFRNAICHASGMQFIFRNATKSCVHGIVLSAVAALAVSLLQRQNGDGSEKERARSLAQKRKRRQNA